MRRLFTIALCGAVSVHCVAQGLEDIFVETYAVSSVPGRPDEALTTYRIFADLAEGYSMQMVYGDAKHDLKLITDTEFYNDTLNGDKFGDRLNGNMLQQWPLAIDTWLTIGAASDMHSGVPKHLDPDGSILTCPPYPGIGPSSAGSASSPPSTLCAVDGMVRDTSRNEVVDFRCSTGYLHKVRGGTINTNDGAWARLGGSRGTTSENMVLLAQITTTGTLSFQLNIQIAAPDRSVENHVHSAPAEGEHTHPALTFPRAR